MISGCRAANHWHCQWCCGGRRRSHGPDAGIHRNSSSVAGADSDLTRLRGGGTSPGRGRAAAAPRPGKRLASALYGTRAAAAVGTGRGCAPGRLAELGARATSESTDSGPVSGSRDSRREGLGLGGRDREKERKMRDRESEEKLREREKERERARERDREGRREGERKGGGGFGEIECRVGGGGGGRGAGRGGLDGSISLAGHVRASHGMAVRQCPGGAA